MSNKGSEDSPSGKRQRTDLEHRHQVLSDLYTKHGQAHVFRFYDDLSEEEKDSLLTQLEKLDVAQVNENFKQMNEYLKHQAQGTDDVKPFPLERIADLETSPSKQEWRRKGMELIADGRVALLLLAGGQGTRLCATAPKGLYDIGLPSGRTLFQIQAERVAKLKQLAATECHKKSSPASLPWYVLTSVATHAETVAYFKQNNYFGLPAEDIFFFQQDQAPCLTESGKIIMESKFKVSLAPNGNGGVCSAAGRHGVVADMEKRGIKWVHLCGVDNVLIKVADPHFIGFGEANSVDCSNKVVVKEDPHERVGVMCLKNNQPFIVEYSEITKQDAEARDPTTNQLLFGAGNIVNHLFSFPFFAEMSKVGSLPFHSASKAIPCVGDDGATHTPPKPNGIKMEMFIFDTFLQSKRMRCLAVRREGEFAPVKNAPGPADKPVVKDSPDSARIAMGNYHAELVEKAGGKVLRNDSDRTVCLEIAPLLSYDGEGLEEVAKGRSFSLPCTLEP